MDRRDKGAAEGLLRLFDLGQLQELGLEAWMKGTLRRCAKWFRASGGSVFLADETGLLRLNCSTGALKKLPPDTVVRPGVGLAGKVFETGRPRIVGDPAQEPDLAHLVARRADIASSMVVPLVGPGQERLGVLNLSRRSGEPPFEQADLSQAVRLGSVTALAVANARLVTLLEGALKASQDRLGALEAVLEAASGSVFPYGPGGVLEPGLPAEPRLAEALRSAAEAAWRSGERTQDRFHDPDGDTTWLLNAVPGKDGGIVTLLDVSATQKAQDEAARLRRLAEIGQMTAAVAHEVRNPLTGIRGAAQLMLSDPAGSPEYAAIVLEETEKLEALCEDFLELARPLRLLKRPARLGELLQRLGALWSVEFEARQVSLDLEIEADDPTIPLDVSRVEQVVHNLLRNALEACQPGDRVKLASSAGRLTVEDTGAGMDESARSRLFSPFFTTRARGTGLGLCNVRRIVDAHGASVEVRSKQGEGTRFDIQFPDRAA